MISLSHHPAFLHSLHFICRLLSSGSSCFKRETSPADVNGLVLMSTNRKWLSAGDEHVGVICTCFTPPDASLADEPQPLMTRPEILKASPAGQAGQKLGWK
uniref:Uncharacterized protein n=1 Tax=Poecilia reticulata TaxID=8081 RepID=A0A3P9QC19_POERE